MPRGKPIDLATLNLQSQSLTDRVAKHLTDIANWTLGEYAAKADGETVLALIRAQEPAAISYEKKTYGKRTPITISKRSASTSKRAKQDREIAEQRRVRREANVRNMREMSASVDAALVAFKAGEIDHETARQVVLFDMRRNTHDTLYEIHDNAGHVIVQDVYADVMVGRYISNADQCIPAYIGTLTTRRPDALADLLARIKTGAINDADARTELATVATLLVTDVAELVNREGQVVYAGTGTESEVCAQYQETLRVHRVW